MLQVNFIQQSPARQELDARVTDRQIYVNCEWWRRDGNKSSYGMVISVSQFRIFYFQETSHLQNEILNDVLDWHWSGTDRL